MTRHTFSAVRALTLAAALLVVAVAPAAADSSSWFTRDTETPIPKLAPSPKAQPLSPLSPPTAGSSVIQKTIPSNVPATGDDAAYTAFDQGQY
ncbi:MAG: hypothetical protein ABWZ19_05650, partial [Hyphomicrobium sp.]